MRIRSRWDDSLFNVFNYSLMIMIIIVTFFPFWNQFVISFSHPKYLTEVGKVFFPQSINLNSYKTILQYDQIWIGYANTILRTVGGVILSLVFTTMTAYPLSKMELPFNKTLTLFVLFTLLFSGGLIPSYLLIKELGLLNSYWALVIPVMISPINVFIIRNYFRSLPRELEESAVIDGANSFRIFTKIALPLSKPILSTVSLWVAVYHWLAWYDAFLYLSDTKKWVLQLIVRRIIIDNRPNDILSAAVQTVGRADVININQLMAALIMITILPMLFVYPFLQRYFVSGLMHGAIKG